MVESNLEYYSTDSHCGVRWKNPPKSSIEEMMEEEPSTLWNAVLILLAGGGIVAVFIAFFWVLEIISYALGLK